MDIEVVEKNLKLEEAREQDLQNDNQCTMVCLEFVRSWTSSSSSNMPLCTPVRASNFGKPDTGFRVVAGPGQATVPKWAKVVTIMEEKEKGATINFISAPPDSRMATTNVDTSGIE